MVSVTEATDGVRSIDAPPIHREAESGPTISRSRTRNRSANPPSKRARYNEREPDNDSRFRPRVARLDNE